MAGRWGSFGDPPAGGHNKEAGAADSQKAGGVPRRQPIRACVGQAGQPIQ